MGALELLLTTLCKKVSEKFFLSETLVIFTYQQNLTSMDLSYKIVRYCTLEIVAVTGTYPQTDNCYHVKVTDNKGVSFEAHYCPKPVYDMWKLLSSAADLLPKEMIEGMVQTFNDYGGWKWYEADYDASMNDAGEDL